MQKPSLVIVGVFVGICLSTFAQDNPSQVRESLARQCIDKAFVSVFVRTRSRDTIPHLELLLTDPLGRSQGHVARGAQLVPDSSYGEIVQLLNRPEHSKALGIEVCNAEPGIYEVKVKEQGPEPYVLDVTGREMGGSESLLLHHMPTKGRILHYRFRFKIDNARVVVRWLNNKGQDQMEIEPNDW